MNISRRNKMIKISIRPAIWIALSCMFLFGAGLPESIMGVDLGAFGTGDALAAITQPGAWTQAYSGTANNVTYSYTAAAGSDRVVAVAIYDARAANATITPTVTFGGVALTEGRSDRTVSQRMHTLFYYLPEAQIPVGAQSLVVNVGGTVQRLFVAVGTFAGVDQTIPIDSSQNAYRNTNGSTAVFTANFTINTNCQGVLLTNVYNLSGTTTITMTTNPPTGFAAAALTYSDRTTNAKQFSLNNYATIPATAVNTTASHGTLSPTTCGFSMTGVSLLMASGGGGGGAQVPAGSGLLWIAVSAAIAWYSFRALSREHSRGNAP